MKHEKELSGIVKKDVSAIHVNAKLSLIQRKLSNALLLHAYEHLVTDKSHEIDISLLCGVIGFEGRNYAHLKDSLRGLVTTPIEWDVFDEKGETSWGVSTLLAEAKIEKGKCIYEYSSSLAEKLYNPEVYSRINMAVQRKFTSTHALALYENCNRFINTKSTGFWSLDQFRKLMGLQGDEYYTDFKRLNARIIKPAVKEVNASSNILLEPEFKKNGRKVSHVKFHVNHNPQLALLEIEENDDINSSKIYKRLVKMGVSKVLARQWIIEFGEEYLEDKVDYTSHMKQSGRIKSSQSGFLKKAVEEDYQTEVRAEKEARKRVDDAQKKRREAEKQVEALKAQRKQIERENRQAVWDVVEKHFSALPPATQEELQREFIVGLSSKFYVDDFKKSGWTGLLIFLDVCAFWEAKGLSFPSIQQIAKAHDISDWNALLDKLNNLEKQVK